MKTVVFNGEELVVRIGKYQNGRVSIALVDQESMPYATASVNIPDADLGPGEVAIKDYSENTGILAMLIDAGIVVDTGRKIGTGFVTVPVAKLVE